VLCCHQPHRAVGSTGGSQPISTQRASIVDRWTEGQGGSRRGICSSELEKWLCEGPRKRVAGPVWLLPTTGRATGTCRGTFWGFAGWHSGSSQLKCAFMTAIPKFLLGSTRHRPTPSCELPGRPGSALCRSRLLPFSPQVRGLQEVMSTAFMTSVTFASVVRGCNLRA
jgi:hypothetical protein